MSQRHLVQDASGVVAGDENGDILIIASAEDPSSTRDNAAGYAKGCLFIDTLNAKVYVNNDSTVTANWRDLSLDVS